MTEQVETFQISIEQAEYYESKFVPAIFGEWANHLIEAAQVAPGDRVLDVGCGTGVVARDAVARVGPTGRVVGIDLNNAMLTVARRLSTDVEWRQGDAADLPFEDGSFDVVLCQAALMFLPDVPSALREMGRVGADGGAVGVEVFDALSAQPAYGPFVEAVARHAGPDAVDILGTYWRLGDLGALRATIESVGLDIASSTTLTGTARFDSIDELVAIEVKGTPLVDRVGDDAYLRIVADVGRALGRFVKPDGRLEMPIRGHVVVARIPGRD